MTVLREWGDGADDPFAGADTVCYESDTARALVPVSLGLVAAYVAFAVLHRVVYHQAPGVVMTVAVVASATLVLAVAIAAWRRAIPDRASHAAMFLVVSVTTVDATIHLVLTRDPRETMGFLFLLVGIGMALLRRTWFVAALVGIWVCWLAAVVGIGGWGTWDSWAFYMVVASGLGIAVMVLRRRSIDVASAALRCAMRAATEDPATGLANRRDLAMLSRELVAVARRRGEIVHCAFLDVDGLKTINDEHGHDTGDRVIAAVAEAIRSTSRSSDVVARWGGDEFVVVGLGPCRPLKDVEDRVTASLRAGHGDDPTVAGLHISVGSAELAPWEEGDYEKLLWKADHDMYERRARRPGARTVFLPDGVHPFEP